MSGTVRCAALLAAAAALFGGCGGTNASAPAAEPPLPVLPLTVLPTLPATTHPLGARLLAADGGPESSLAAELGAWGYRRGTERVFQGESHRFDRVVSRTLEFAGPGGARAYVRYVATHLAALFGTGSTAKALDLGGRAGYLVTAAACACHRAEPTLVAVLAHGARAATSVGSARWHAQAAAVTR